MQRRRVVLPQPLGPRRKKSSPGSTTRSSPWSAVTEPKRLLSFSIRMEIIAAKGRVSTQGAPTSKSKGKPAGDFSPRERNGLPPAPACPFVGYPAHAHQDDDPGGAGPSRRRIEIPARRL